MHKLARGRWMVAMALAAPVWANAATSPQSVEAAPASPPSVVGEVADDGRILDRVEVVAGVQPGPRLWRVRKGDHVMHVLATVRPLPSRMSWDGDYVQGVIARSQEYILPPDLSITANVGLFKGLTLLPALRRTIKNPDGKTLKDVLPPALYARFSAARQHYLPREKGIEDRRPFIAAEQLYQAALKQNGLGGRPVVTPVLNEAVKRHGLKTTDTGITLKLDDPKAAMVEVQRGHFDDVRCLRQTLDSMDRELPVVARRANAWATGDIATLRALVGKASDGEGDCLSALTEMDFARKHGISNVPQRLRAQWLAAAEAALSRNASTFAMLPLSQVVGPDNYLDALRAKGYEVIEP